MAGSGEASVNSRQSGPPVLVVGAHRSGTSAVAGALGSLGLAVPIVEDRMVWLESNPEHWESLSLSLHNEELLNRMAGSWDAPPDLPAGWEDGSEIRGVADPTPLIAASFPEEGPFVWKDPRVCLLLPYWRRLLAGPIAAVLVWREPMAVARSLRKRDRMSLTSGLAIWTRYNCAALEGLVGVDTYVVGYESIIEDPEVFVDAVVGWLGSLPQLEHHADGWDRESAVASIDAGLRHQESSQSEETAGLLIDEQQQVVDRLTAMNGGHRPLRAISPNIESAWSAALIAQRAELRRLRGDLQIRSEELGALNEELRATRAELVATGAELSRTVENLAQANQSLAETREHLDRAIQIIENMQSSTSWRVTRPVRSVLSSLHGMREDHPNGRSL
jgi:hypothetical protein